jgi:hypothetical protein
MMMAAIIKQMTSALDMHATYKGGMQLASTWLSGG